MSRVKMWAAASGEWRAAKARGWAGAVAFAVSACSGADVTRVAPERSELGPAPPRDGVAGAASAPPRSEPGSELDSSGGPSMLAEPGAVPAFLGMPETAMIDSRGFTTEAAAPELTFDFPVHFVDVPDNDESLIVEREGRVFAVALGSSTPEKRLVLDLSGETQGYNDSGLMGLVLHPDFGRPGSPNRGTAFVHYQYSDAPLGPGVSAEADSRARLMRFQMDPDSLEVDPGSFTVLIDQLDENLFHAGASMFFHPVDGFLYLSLGDEGSRDCRFENCQLIDRDLFSGVLRIDVDSRGGAISHPIVKQPLTGTTANYYVPSDNPFVGVPGALEEFYAVGLRSPHRMSYDATSGVGFIADVGQGRAEEINVLAPGANYQWAVREGGANRAQPGAGPGPGVWTDPILSLGRDESRCVIGGEVYRGQLFPELWGRYVFGDYYFGTIWAASFEQTAGAVSFTTRDVLIENLLGRLGTIAGFGFASDGEIYILVAAENTTLQRLVRNVGTANIPPLLSETRAFSDAAALAPNAALRPYEVQSPLWSDGAAKQRWFVLPEGETISFSELGPWHFPEGTVFVKHFELALDERRPRERRRLETRLLVAARGGRYYGVSYRWDEAGTDARALLASEVEEFDIIDAQGASRRQLYYYPGPSDCLVCHNADAGFVLGVRTAQLNGTFSDREGNQLLALAEEGLLDVNLGPQDVAAHPSLVPLSDASRSLEDRVRSYWDSNCSMCHGVVAGLRTEWDARYSTPLAAQGVIDTPALAESGLAGLLVAPGAPEASVLFQRVQTTDLALRMPPLARNRIDAEYVDILERWILSL